MGDPRCARNVFALQMSLLACVFAWGGAAPAQSDPSKTVKFFLPSAPGSSPERFAEVLRVDTPMWKQRIQAAGIKAE